MSDLYLGTDDTGERSLLESAHLTTHAVCLGMTGSGKTGLGIVALEELARNGIPVLVIDLKGDLVNLLLTFPDLDGASFSRWIPEEEGGAGAASEIAERWRSGLERSGLGSSEVRAVKERLGWQLLTPGATSGAPVDILPALSPPVGGTDDSRRERVDSIVSALLSLIGKGGDPLADPDHVLIAQVILANWEQGKSLDLPTLLGEIADPPMKTLGALPLDTVYPRSDRMKLVLALNTLIASPSFKAWTTGTPLSMEAMLGTSDAPRGTILSLAHLEDRERIFFLSMLFGELVGWMRDQGGTSNLRCLMYLDEVQGILPPHPHNPPTKGPLMTLLKQGRAFGVGVWLSTQNPIDLDYKALGNAGVKLIGRLITERDRERALEGLGLSGTEEGREIETKVAGLDKREFLLVNVRSKKRVQTFSSRWAMSYLRGPITLAEMGDLLEAAKPLDAPQPAHSAGTAAASSTSAAPAPAPAKRNDPPVLPMAMDERFVGTGPASLAIAVSMSVSVSSAKYDLDTTREESWLIPLDDGGRLEQSDAERLDDLKDFDGSPRSELEFPATAPDGLGKTLKTLEKTIVAWRARTGFRVLANESLGLTAEDGEGKEAFVGRCLGFADRADDDQQEKMRDRFEARIDKVKVRIAKEEAELDRDLNEVDSRKAEEKLGMVEGLLSLVLGARSLRGVAKRAASKARAGSTRRRMRQKAEASVTESEDELDRLERDIEDLQLELEEAVDEIAQESDAKARRVKKASIRIIQRDVVIEDVYLVWRGESE